MKKMLSICLAAIVLLGAVSALADDFWSCPQCGQAGNAGNFCSNCGNPRPEASWACASCGMAGNTGNFCSNCGAARPGQAAAVNSQLEQIPGEANRVRVLIAAADAHAYIVGKEPLRWAPDKTFDRDDGTCWQFSSKAKGVLGNAWLELALNSPQTVDALWVKNGFWGDQSRYVNNARLKGIRVEFLYNGASSYANPMEFTLKDDKTQADWQRLELGHHTNVLRVRIWVLSKYAGAKYENDVCLNEVMLVQNAPASSALPAQPDKEPTVYSTASTGGTAKLLMRLSTRSGPGTEYDEPGTFFNDSWKTQTVQVLGKFWDSRNDIWWVLVDFSSGGARYRVWTGLKRVDVNINSLQQVYSQGQGTVSATDTRRGPGGNYAKGPRITSWQDVEAYGRENGYVEVEWRDYDKNMVYRCWVPESAASIDWNWLNDANN